MVASSIGVGVACVIGLVFTSVPRLLLAIFGMDDGVQFDLARQLLAYLAVPGLFVTVALVYTGGLKGTGDTRSPLYIAMISQVVVPIGLCSYLQMARGLKAPDIWLAIVLGHVARASLSVARFRQGRWRDIAVDIGSARA